jgi:hypothetical protein
MCQKQLLKKPSELYKKGRCSQQLQLPDMEMTLTALHYRIKKSAVVTNAIGPVRLLRVKQVSKFSTKTGI